MPLEARVTSTTRPVLAAVGLVVAGSLFVLRPVFRQIARTGLREIFTAAALLLVPGMIESFAAVLRAGDGPSATISASPGSQRLVSRKWFNAVRRAIERQAAEPARSDPIDHV